MARVFVSFASDDVELAVEVRRWLVDGGHEVLLDQDRRDGIAIGEKWQQRLHERLLWADAVVCVVTSAYLASVGCVAEVGIARSRGSRLLPVLAERGVVHPLLTSVQHVDVDTAVGRVELSEALRWVDAAGGLGWPDGRSPFPGLRPFDTDLHRVFFGRTGEVKQLAALLRSPAEPAKGAVVLVVGPSGCGKSSLVRAGLLPVMADEPGWSVLPAIVPGSDPITALTRELAAAARRVGVGWTVADVRCQLDDVGLAGVAAELLLAIAGRQPRCLLVVVDQFEELWTQSAPDERVRFAELLRPALGGPVQVVATLRSEFLDQLLVSSELAALPTHIHTLRPLRREVLRAVIEGPAQLAGIGVDADLVTRLVADTDSGDALPLLAYTLAKLADGIERNGRLLTARYEQLGGVQGALTRQADTALAEAMAVGGRSRSQVIVELLRLVTVDEQGRPRRWQVRRDELPELAVAELDAFIAHRLLTTDTENGCVVIEVTHEALLSAWRPLCQVISVDLVGLRLRSELRRLAAEWDKAGMDKSYLLRGSRLAHLDQWVSHHAGELDSLEQQFLQASHQLASRERGLFSRLFRAPSDELQVELRKRQVQLHEQASILQLQERQLREQALRLCELADFDQRSATAGGVFISYSHDDKDIVDALASRFDEDRINYWRDEKDLFVGDVIDRAVSKGIQESLLFLIVLTPNSIRSKWVERELDEAAHEEAEGHKIVLPVVAKNLKNAGIPPRLRRKLYVDISTSFDDGYAKLARTIRLHFRK